VYNLKREFIKQTANYRIKASRQTKKKTDVGRVAVPQVLRESLLSGTSSS
jgi:hypothetical protein